MKRPRYQPPPDDGFRWTDAVRPAPGVEPPAREGYRIETFTDGEDQLLIPLLSALVSAERVFDVFLDLIEPLGEVVQVVLETSHGRYADRHDDLRRDEIDVPVLSSHLCDFESLLVNDGCTGLAVLATDFPAEVQFDEHKQLSVYAPDVREFRRVLRRHGVARLEELTLPSEREHFHYSTPEQAEEFERLAVRLGVGEFASVFTDDLW